MRIYIISHFGKYASDIYPVLGNCLQPADRFQRLPKLPIIDLHAVIQIDFDFLGSHNHAVSTILYLNLFPPYEAAFSRALSAFVMFHCRDPKPIGVERFLCKFIMIKIKKQRLVWLVSQQCNRA